MPIRRWGKENTNSMLMSVQSGSATMELVLKDPQRIKIGLSHDSDGSTLGNIPKGLCILL